MLAKLPQKEVEDRVWLCCEYEIENHKHVDSTLEREGERLSTYTDDYW